MRSFLRANLRLNRLTGQLAVGLVGVLAIGAGVFGVGMASSRYDLSDVGAWLTAQRKGALVHANGLAGKVDGRAGLISQMRGHRIKVVQDGGTVLIVDLDTGVVSRLDPSQLKVAGSRAFGTPGLQVVIGAGRAYTVDAVGGTVQRIDPITLAALGQPTRLTPPLGAAGIDATGTLWVPAPQTGQAVPFRDGRQGSPLAVGKAGDRLALTIAAGSPVLVNSTAATATVVKSSGGVTRVELPPSVRQSGAAGVLAPPDTEGPVVPLLAKESASLVLLHTGTGAPSAARLRVPEHRLGVPHILGAKVYIPDESAGALLVFNSRTNAFERPIVITGAPASLDVFVKDGLLWANAPSGDRAIVLDKDGGKKEIRKYQDEAPDGRRRLPLPTPAGPGGSGGPSGPGSGSTPAPPRQPRLPAPTTPPPPGAPNPPTGVEAARSSTDELVISFAPSQGGTPTGYVLKDVPRGATVTPAVIPPNGTPQFTVSGLNCTARSFRVAVQYKDARNRTAEVLSEPNPALSPCVAPGEPTGVTATATSSGAKLTWTAPQNDGGSPITSYSIKWTGPTSGQKTGITGTSATLADIYHNGSYNFTVTAISASGQSETPASPATLKGPAQRYAIQHNGKSNANIYRAPDKNSGTIGSVFDNGHTLTVQCQKKGVFYDRGVNNAYFKGDLYDYITYNGMTGYMIGFLVATPRQPDWQQYAGPPLWVC